MTRQREYFIRDGVLFDAHNVRETARHCLPRNPLLQGLCGTSAEAAAERFIQEALTRITKLQHQPGEMVLVYNAWIVVDPPTPRLFGIADVDLNQAMLEVNFFVRPGRLPPLRGIATKLT